MVGLSQADIGSVEFSGKTHDMTHVEYKLVEALSGFNWVQIIPLCVNHLLWLYNWNIFAITKEHKDEIISLMSSKSYNHEMWPGWYKEKTRPSNQWASCFLVSIEGQDKEKEGTNSSLWTSVLCLKLNPRIPLTLIKKQQERRTAHILPLHCLSSEPASSPRCRPPRCWTAPPQ